MIYAFSHRRSPFPNQIFRRLILINGAFNVIFLLNIHCSVATPPPPCESSKRETLLSFLDSVLCFLTALRLPVLTNTSLKEQTKRKSFFRQKAAEILRSICYQICSIWAKKSNDSKQMNDTETSSEAARRRTQFWAFKGAQPDDALFMLLFRLQEVKEA